MSKKVNLVLINQRMREKEDKINLGVTMANYEANGISIESAQEEAKEQLEIDPSDILLLEYEKALTDLRKDSQNFVAFVNAIRTAEESGVVTSEELEPMQKVVAQLEQKMMKRFDIEDVGDLYE